MIRTVCLSAVLVSTGLVHSASAQARKAAPPPAPVTKPGRPFIYVLSVIADPSVKPVVAADQNYAALALLGLLRGYTDNMEIRKASSDVIDQCKTTRLCDSLTFVDLPGSGELKGRIEVRIQSMQVASDSEDAVRPCENAYAQCRKDLITRWRNIVQTHAKTVHKP